MALGICGQWPHLHHSGTGGTGCLGLSGTGCLSGVGGWVGRFGWMSWEPDEEGPAVSLTFKRLIEEPCTFTMGPSSLSSSGTNWLWINSRLPIPFERTLMASLRTVSSSKFCIRFLKRKNLMKFTTSTEPFINIYSGEQSEMISKNYYNLCVLCDIQTCDHTDCVIP